MAKFTKIIRRNTEIHLIKKLTSMLVAKIKRKKNKRFSLVLTGGESPIKLYKYLSKNKNINWKNIDFFITDERYVNEKSKNSNIRMCKKYLLDKIKISSNQIYKILTNQKSIEQSVMDYEKKIKKYFSRNKVCFDLILLGIGDDGHIASLFKKNINKKTNKNVIFVTKSDFKRVSLSLKCLNNCKSIFLWAPGKTKLNIIKKILKDKKFKYPVSFLKKKDNILFYSN